MPPAKRLIRGTYPAKSKDEAVQNFRAELAKYGYDPDSAVIDSGPKDVGRGVYEIMYVRPAKLEAPPKADSNNGGPKEGKKLALTKDKIALVDEEDYQWLSEWKWSASITTKGRVYALRTICPGDGTKHHQYLHRAIWEKHHGAIPEGMQIDHANSDTLDNRIANLRLCNQTQNNGNQRPQVKKDEAHSQYKGVTWNSQVDKWQAQIQCDYNRESIGFFDSEEEAARAYDARARVLFGEFARTNFEAVDKEPASEIEVSKVLITGFNPRKHFDEDRIRELAESIGAIGMLEPVLVRPKGAKYELVIGERRLRAARMIKLERIPAVVREMTDDEVLDAMIAENVCREDLNPIEEANHVKRAFEIGKAKGIGQLELARKYGKSQEWVAHRVALADAPPKLQEAIILRRIKPSSAVQVLHQRGKETYQETLDDILRLAEEHEEVTFEQVREVIRSHTGRIPTKGLPDALLPFAKELRLHPDAVAALKPVAAFPVYHEVIRKLKLMEGAGVELAPEKVAGAVKSSISCDDEAVRSLNLGSPPRDLHERWRHFDAAGCRKCEKPGHIRLEGEKAPDDEFCIDHDCYRLRLAEALERLEAEKGAEMQKAPPEAPAAKTTQPNDSDCDGCPAYKDQECAEGYLPRTCPQHQEEEKDEPKQSKPTPEPLVPDCKHERTSWKDAEDEPGVSYETCEDCGATVGATTKLMLVPDVLECPCCKAKLRLAEKGGVEFLEKAP